MSHFTPAQRVYDRFSLATNRIKALADMIDDICDSTSDQDQRVCALAAGIMDICTRVDREAASIAGYPAPDESSS